MNSCHLRLGHVLACLLLVIACAQCLNAEAAYTVCQIKEGLLGYRSVQLDLFSFSLLFCWCFSGNGCSALLENSVLIIYSSMPVIHTNGEISEERKQSLSLLVA